METSTVLQRIFIASTLRYFILAGIPFLLFYFLLRKKYSGYKIQKRVAKTKDYLREIVHSMQTTLVFTAIAFTMMYSPVAAYTQIYRDINSFPLWYIPVSLMLSLILHDTYFYWMHRLLHHPKLFRYTHITHHKSVSPTPWASYSFNITEAIAEGLVLVPIVFILPMHPLTIILFTIVGFIINVYGHLGYEIAPLWLRKTVLFDIINTSTHHNLHHSKFKGNYGLYFRFWDRVMKTENQEYVKLYDEIQQKKAEGSKAKKGAYSTDWP